MSVNTHHPGKEAVTHNAQLGLSEAHLPKFLLQPVEKERWALEGEYKEVKSSLHYA